MVSHRKRDRFLNKKMAAPEASEFERYSSLDFVEAIHNNLKTTDAFVQSSNDLVAVAARNCANEIHDTGLKLDELLFPLLHSISP